MTDTPEAECVCPQCACGVFVFVCVYSQSVYVWESVSECVRGKES